jgi:HD-GYP domain-containing protein (c-di-GMP phosphodiesterase class II)
VFDYQDSLADLNNDLPLADKLEYIHGVLAERFPFLHRISVAIYDVKTDMLKTYLESDDRGSVLEHYQARLSEASSLREILDSGRPRVINDLSVFGGGEHEHTRRVAAGSIRASYTMPMYLNGNFFGFVFFNSRQANPFSDENLHYFDVFGHLVSLIIISDLSAIRTLAAAVKTARDMAQHRDVETGAHLDRMSHYSRIIARYLADKHELDDEYIERVFLFSPLHDIGKIGVPDQILLKPGKLDEAEFEIMKTHARKGREIIDAMLADFGLHSVQHVDVLRNIAELHHEAVNGSGYPHGLQGDEIPIEARIIAVADVFDALTSKRPYKQAWSNREAFTAMKKAAGIKLDADCVEALMNSEDEIDYIQRTFQEQMYA